MGCRYSATFAAGEKHILANGPRGAHIRAISATKCSIELAGRCAAQGGRGGDIGTADLYTRLVQVHQKDCWFLNELLQKRDGLVS